MTTAEVAEKLTSLCREGKNMEALETLYADDVISVEPVGSEQMPAEQQGLDAVRTKGQWWYDNHEIHSGEVQGPYVGSGDTFAVHFKFDVTFKPTGQRIAMEEMALYTVANGKIAREQFFYNMPGM
jgi:ketosteroid isomerase-like protein